MINEALLYQYCSEDISEIENYEQAIADTTQTWHCHHRREIDENKTRTTLIAEKLYYRRPAAELILLTNIEHRRIHGIGSKGNKVWLGRHHSEETRKKMSEKALGRRRSAETRKKMSAGKIGMKFWNNGFKCIRSRECPGEGWVRGQLRNNNQE